MQVWFNHHGCFIEDEGWLIVRRHGDGKMFILETNNVSATMFASGQKAESDIDLWYKRIGHINYPKLQEL